MKIGLVLEGGAMRGMFTAGVLDLFLAENITVDCIVSVSAGALFGVNFPAKQPGRALRYNKRYLNDKRYISLHSLLTTGNIVNKTFAFHDIPERLDPFDEAAYKQANIDFYATLTNVESGEAEYIKIDEPFKQIEALRATSAMPYVSQIVEYEGKKYLDGAISDSIPLEQCRALGCDKIIVVLTRTFDYRKTPPNPLFAKLFYCKYPRFIDRLNHRYLHYNQKVEEIIRLSQAGEIFVIRPSIDLHVSRIEKDLNKIQAMYDLGIADAKRELAALKRYLQG